MEKRIFCNWLCNKLFLTDRERNFLAQKYICFEDFLSDETVDYGDLSAGHQKELLRIKRELKEKKQVLNDAKELYDRQLEQGILFCHRGEDIYPERLQNIPDPSLGLFYKGKNFKEEITVAVIGARECTYYGQKMARELGEYLGRNGIAVISGMARGIDGIAQEAALLAGGSSYGVLGCGVDVCYPKSNRGLYERLIHDGAILSTYPPGTQPVPAFFPPRNRIVSGLADVVVVVEAGIKSGTLITVDMALEQGREVWIMPGRVDDRLSVGCNRLISQGAEILWNIPEFVGQLLERKYGSKENLIKKEKANPLAEETDKVKKAILKTLDTTPKTVEEILSVIKEDVAVSVLLNKLMELVLEGKAVEPYGGYFSVKQ